MGIVRTDCRQCRHYWAIPGGRVWVFVNGSGGLREYQMHFFRCLLAPEGSLPLNNPFGTCRHFSAILGGPRLLVDKAPARQDSVVQVRR